MFVIFHMYTIFNSEFLGIFLIDLRIIFHMSSPSGLLVVIKSNAQYRFNETVVC
jgi:hypothetical protein